MIKVLHNMYEHRIMKCVIIIQKWRNEFDHSTLYTCMGMSEKNTYFYLWQNLEGK
jgi:hypothetical protein